MRSNRLWDFLTALFLLALPACGPAETEAPGAIEPGAIERAAATEPAESAQPERAVGMENPAACIDSFAPEVDYFPEKVAPRHAEQFQVEYHRHYKVVTVTEPWHGAAYGLRYLLVQCGAPRPEGFDDAELIEIPARTVITTSTTELSHIVRLGLVESLVGHDEFDYVSSPEIRRRIEAGAMVEVGNAPAINVELVVETDADLLLIDSFGDPGLDVPGKLREVGVPVALAPSFLETTALGRAEWIKYTSLFFNRESQAEQTFQEVEQRYGELAETVRRAVGEAGRSRPTVFTGAPIGEVWHVPGGRSYAALLLADAGARYLWADDESTGSLPLHVESVYERAHDADFWLHPSTLASLDEVRAFDERFAEVAAFRQARVYNNDARRNPHGGNDFWETGTARPDLVLADLVEIFHPGLLGDHELVFHRRLGPAEADAESAGASEVGDDLPDSGRIQ